MKVKWLWELTDFVVDVIAIYTLYSWFGWQAAAIGFGFAMLGYIDCLVRGYTVKNEDL